MDSESSTRRSPRAITKFCLGIQYESMEDEVTATMLALAHCSDWSADYISLRIQQDFPFRLSAQSLQQLHWQWVMRRGYGLLTAEEHDIVKIVLAKYELSLTGTETPLCTRPFPVANRFRNSWTFRETLALFPGYDGRKRSEIQAELEIKHESTFGELTTQEVALLFPFGELLENLIRHTMAVWSAAMNPLLLQTPGTRPIRESEHVSNIMDYLNHFQSLYEHHYGLMEPHAAHQSTDLKSHTILIESTGYGIKVFLGLMMADRMFVIERRRKAERVRIGFEKIAPTDVNGENCPICQENLGAPVSSSVEPEEGVRLTICCGQIFGLECLRTWLLEFDGVKFAQTCPMCRFVFPLSFIRKVLTPVQRRLRFPLVEPVETTVNDPEVGLVEDAIRQIGLTNEDEFDPEGPEIVAPPSSSEFYSALRGFVDGFREDESDRAQ